MHRYQVGQKVYIKHTDDETDSINNNIPSALTQKELSEIYTIRQTTGADGYRLNVLGYLYWVWDEEQLTPYHCDDCKRYNTCDKMHCQKEEYMPIRRVKKSKWEDIEWTR